MMIFTKIFVDSSVFVEHFKDNPKGSVDGSNSQQVYEENSEEA